MSRRLANLGRVLRPVRTAWGILGLTAALLAAIEIASQALFSLRDDVELKRLENRTALAGANWLPALYAEQQAAQQSVWEPFAYWRARPFAGRWLNIDGRGLRRTVAPPAGEAAADLNSAHKKTVLCFGGSAMWGWLARDEDTIASQLAAQCAAAALPCEIVNHAQIGYVTTQELIALVRQLQRGDRPDAVILFHGYNDVLSALQNLEAGLSQHEPDRAAEFHPTALQALLLAAQKSGTGRLARNLGQMTGLSRATGHRSAANLTDAEIAALADAVVQHYEATLSALCGLGQQQEFELLVYWQPMVFTKRPLADEERPWVTKKARLADLAAAVRERVLKSHAYQATPVHDLSDLFGDHPAAVFLDEVHLSPAGYRACADRIWVDLAPRLRDAKSP